MDNNRNLLTAAQAEAVYAAMCALNNVGGRLTASMADRRVYESAQGWITVLELLGQDWEPGERYASQAEFADHYGISR